MSQTGSQALSDSNTSGTSSPGHGQGMRIKRLSASSSRLQTHGSKASILEQLSRQRASQASSDSSLSEHYTRGANRTNTLGHNSSTLSRKTSSVGSSVASRTRLIRTNGLVRESAASSRWKSNNLSVFTDKTSSTVLSETDTDASGASLSRYL